MKSIKRLFIVGAAVASLAVASPAAAATQDYGALVNCRYRITEGQIDMSFVAALRKIAVLPPTMLAKKPHQKVGWRFQVMRSTDIHNTTWNVTYTSPLQTAWATPTVAAQFDTMRVDVALPRNEDVRDWTRYVVSLIMIWYRADGTVGSRATYLMPNYSAYIDGELWDRTQGGWWDYCPALSKAWLDGPF